MQLHAIIPEDYKDLRLDQALAKCFPEHSRMRLTQWIKAGYVTVGGEVVLPRAKVKGGEAVHISAELQAQQDCLPEGMALSIVYEDEAIIVINKPAGLVVHPGAGNRQGTLMNGLLSHVPALQFVPRAGIVHRLDKDTTGLMVVAKTLPVHTALVSALQARNIQRQYLALVGHAVIAGGTIDVPIARHPHQRTKMAVVARGKPARTHYRVRQRYRGFTLLHVTLDTGRTHQIRVHLAHQGLPIVGDATYGWRYRIPERTSTELQQVLQVFRRQALHAAYLSFDHPLTAQKMQWEAPLPQDFENILSLLPPQEE